MANPAGSVDDQATATPKPPLWLIFTVSVTGVLSNSLLTPNIPDVLSDLGQPESRAGLLVAISPLPGVLMAPIIGILADRFGRRRVLAPCLVSFGVAAVLSATAPTFGVLLLARFLQGLGGAGMINLAVVLIGDNWEGTERTRIIGRNSAVITVSLALMPSISGLVGEYAGWRWALGLGMLTVPVGLAAWRLLPDRRPGAQRTVREQLGGAAKSLRQPQILTILASGFVLFVVIFGVFLTALPVHLEEQFGLSAGPRGLILSTFAIGATIASFNLGRVRARVSARTVLVLSCAIIAVTSVAIGLAPTVLLVVVACIAYGFGDGAAIPMFQDLITSAAPDEQRASVTAAWVSGIRLGQTVGPLGAAALFAATSTRTTMLVGAAIFAVLGLALVIAPLESPSDD